MAEAAARLTERLGARRVGVFGEVYGDGVQDLTYGADPVLAARLGLQRQWLHAVGLGFEHPGTGAPVRFESPYPADLQTALDRVSA